MAFINGTHRDTVGPLGLTWLKPGHMLPLTFVGPSYSSASELISIFCMMSFRRLCCLSRTFDISFILKRKTQGHVVRLCAGTLILPEVPCWQDLVSLSVPWPMLISFPPLEAACASKTTIKYFFSHINVPHRSVYTVHGTKYWMWVHIFFLISKEFPLTLIIRFDIISSKKDK